MLLSAIMRKQREERRAATVDEYGWYIEKTRFMGEPYNLPLAWFVTNGCSADRAGSCTICNFGAGHGIETSELTRQLDTILDHVMGLPMIYITPLGSMFDDSEVPPQVRRDLFDRLGRSGCRLYGTESRPDTISREKIASFRQLFPKDVVLQVGLGVESANPYVRRNCINKGLSQTECSKAIDILHEQNVEALVHVLLKPPFLTEREAVADALDTIRWAFECKADGIVFCMTNLKAHTLAHWLQQRGRFRVPYVWSGLKVLRELPHEQLRRCVVSGLYSGVTILETARNCSKCTDQIIAGLQRFSSEADPGILEDLDRTWCDCREHWNMLMAKEEHPLMERLAEEFHSIAREILGESWWMEFGKQVLEELRYEE